MEFTNLDVYCRERIETFIDSAISGQVGQRRFATLEDFDIEARPKAN